MMSLNVSDRDKEKVSNGKQEEKDKKEEKDEVKSKTIVGIATIGI